MAINPALLERQRVRKVAAGTTGPLAWEDIALLLKHGRVDALATRLGGLTARQRAAVAPDLRRYAAELDEALLHPDGRDRDDVDRAAGLAVCAAAVLPDARAVAKLMTRRGLREALPAVDPGLMTRAARDRGAAWLGDVGLNLANRLDQRTARFGWPLAAALIKAGGAAWPTHDAFVTGWVENLVTPCALPHHPAVRPPLHRLRADPCLDPLLPRMFEVDGLCGLLGEAMTPAAGATGTPMAFGQAIVALVGEGRIARAVVLDGGVARLLRGDRPAAARAVAALLTALDPMPDEVAERAEDLCRLLVEATAPVAGRVQRWLRAADAHRPLDPDLFLRSSRPVLGRPERNLVRAQVLWLDRFTRRHPERVPEIREAAAIALDHPSVELQKRVRALIAKLSPEPKPRLVASPGEVVPPPVVDALPAPPSDAPPAPIASVDELAEEIVALGFAPVTHLSVERLLDAVVRFHTDSPRALAERLDAVREHWAVGPSAAHALTCLGALFDAAVDGRRQEWVANRFRNWERVRDLDAESSPVPQRLVVLRLLEMAHRLRRAPVPLLVSTPTSANGMLDPAALRERLARAAREGWDPWRYDLRQAFLRLPRGATLGSTVDSDAGRELAAWLDGGGLPDAEPTRVVIPRRERRYPDRPWADWEYDRLPTARMLVGLRSPVVERPRSSGITPPRTPGPADLLTVTPPERIEGSSFLGDVQLWPAVAPAHRETIAAHLLPWVAATADEDLKGALLVLPLLAECTGPVGPALTLALAYGLGARWPQDRVAATDALLLLRATGALDAEALGADLADLVVRGLLKANRVEAALSDLTQGGAPGVAWAVLRAMLPTLLTTVPTPRALAGFVTLAATAAGTSGAQPGDVIPGLAELAGRPRHNRLINEARRLYAVVGPL
ncbi:hypothetical protein Val02_86330 [Virgisporangium aliadipatigenens]|uniref:Secreted protein n=1 Tax=Virgisporangium aliadipatigenens TaxID=741659 RepID=A0A8J4DX54_9ACTN|nr:DUF6493 family protein [Virgisporangium aliadipatigenens]GIJ51747.1 hypothetical protein Val02_86330 [Virgisporangium aliadipatigenens]